jgi:Zn-dependent peptidase ImmA (M78 family)
METSLHDRIIESRRLLQNPYAYLDGNDGYSALPRVACTTSALAVDIAKSRKRLEDPYAYLDDVGGFSATRNTLHSQVESRCMLPHGMVGKYSSFAHGANKKSHYANDVLEKKAKDLHAMMWRDKSQIWLDNVPANPIAMLNPELAFQLIGYDYSLNETLGQYHADGKQIEVAGIIDATSRQVCISRQFSHEVRNFTAAHELGHALCHDARGLHRDRPLDGTTMSREKIEIEADKFASYFLMPAKLVKACFKRHFGTEHFFLNDDTRFALGRGVSSDRTNCRTLRDLSRVLASAESYNGERFVSLAGQFHVSVGAMAIRLEELALVVSPNV